MSAPHGLGATYLGDGRCRFGVWAPFARTVEARLLAPRERLVPLQGTAWGYHQAVVDGVEPGTLYLYRLDEGRLERPDPASRWQPQGVHGPSAVVEPAFPWEDASWRGLPLRDYVLYELHVGTFSAGGTFEGVIPYLDYLRDLGVTAVELMPVAQFPGERNWGYDGVYPFAVQSSYGGPQGLKRLVDACHQRGLAVVLDVVYNHLGPEGNYLGDYAPYFTERYRTPWGLALNFDGADSDEVRRYFVENALHWVTDYHFDALRLDAVHAILDASPHAFLQELAEAVRRQAERLGRRIYLFPESSANDSRLIRSPEVGGYGLDAQWNDDFHHALHTLLTAERTGYYQDYGSLRHLAKALREGYAYSGEYSAYRRRRHGTSSADIPAHRFVVCAQNHDHVGNRLHSERLSRLVPFEAQKLAAALVILSPFLPLLFMGEEYGEAAPFHYFVSHSDPGLVEAARRGRREEFAAFAWQGTPPDPQDEAIFRASRLDHALRSGARHAALLGFYRELLRLRRETAPLANLDKGAMEVVADEASNTLLVRRWTEGEETAAGFHLGDSTAHVTLPLPAGRWRRLLDSAEERWCGPGGHTPPEFASKGAVVLEMPPYGCVLLERKEGA